MISKLAQSSIKAMF
ncbi:hypothetical protein ACP1N7_001059 [Escherichia coli]